MWRNRLNGWLIGAALLLAVGIGASAQSQIGQFLFFTLNGNTVTAPAGTAAIVVPNVAQTLLGTTTICTTANWCQATVTLTDAQIKALPTTPVLLVAAQGAGTLVQPLYANIFAKTTAGAYTNINAASQLSVEFATSLAQPMSYVVNDAAITNGSKTRLTDLLGGANNRRTALAPSFDTEGLDTWGQVAGVEPSTDGANQALNIYINNSGSGVLTGGNAANTLTWIFTYRVVTVP